jgi:hypothetical protein
VLGILGILRAGVTFNTSTVAIIDNTGFLKISMLGGVGIGIKIHEQSRTTTTTGVAYGMFYQSKTLAMKNNYRSSNALECQELN